MKVFKILVLILSSFQMFAQPGPDVIFPTDINLNQYPSFRSIVLDTITFDFKEKELGVITIDSTSDLSLIPLLKKEKYLSLKIRTPNVPTEINSFSQTIGLSLIIESDSTDVAFINEFPNLKAFKLQTTGNIGFSEYLSLDSLKVLDIEFCKELTSLESFKKVNSLERISLRYVPRLKAFPEFETNNQVKYVRIYQETSSGCTNCLPNPNKLDITNLNKLKHLEELELSNVNGITKIPNDLSTELRIFKIFDIQRANKDYAIRSYIQDVSGFSNYGKLETIELSGVHIKEFKGNFEKLNLKKLTLRWVYGLEDISGIFTMNSIDHLWIEKCGIQTINGLFCNAYINKIIFSDCSRIENIDFLLSCERINYLQLGGGPMLLLPKPAEWKIANLNMYGHGKSGKFHVSKKEGEIVESLNLEHYIK